MIEGDRLLARARRCQREGRAAAQLHVGFGRCQKGRANSAPAHLFGDEQRLHNAMVGRVEH